MRMDVTLRFLVQDTGIGIPSDRAETLFRPFTQADTSVTREYGGTGLGLAISKKIAEMMGGEIGVWSEEGVGSNFWFTAVLKKQPAKKSRDTAVQETEDTPCLRTDRPIRILVAEDNLFNQKITGIVLKQIGFDSDIAGDGLEAIQMLKSTNYDLILMDIHMPKMDGIEATERIRGTDAAYKTIPIIALTADVIAEGRDMWMRSGMNGYITKPVNPQHLKKLIVQHITAQERDA